MDNNKETVRREMSNSCMRTLLLYHQKCACWNANRKYLIICDSNGCIHFTTNKGVFLFKYQILSKEEQEQNVYFFSFLEPQRRVISSIDSCKPEGESDVDIIVIYCSNNQRISITNINYETIEAVVMTSTGSLLHFMRFQRIQKKSRPKGTRLPLGENLSQKTTPQQYAQHQYDSRQGSSLQIFYDPYEDCYYQYTCGVTHHHTVLLYKWRVDDQVMTPYDVCSLAPTNMHDSL